VRSSVEDFQIEEPMNTDQDQTAESEAVTLARRMHDKHRRQGATPLEFDHLPFLHRLGWIEAARMFLTEREPTVASLCAEVQRQTGRADKAEADLRTALTIQSRTEAEAEKAKAEARAEARTAREARAAAAERLQEEPKAKAEEASEGIEGILIEAGTLEDGVDPVTGLVVSVPWQVLLDAKRVPLYCKVKVIEIPATTPGTPR
jgi:hypothetical protein